MQCWDFGPIFLKKSEILTFPQNWSELGIPFNEKLEKLTFHMKLASKFALKLQGTNPPKGCNAIKVNPVEAETTRSNESDSFLPVVREADLSTGPP